MSSAAVAAAREARGKWSGTLVDTAEIPGGGQLQLVRYGQHYEILFDDEQLMGSWAYRSEQALASLVAERLGGRAKQILIGGLGMGFTLTAARSAFPASAEFVVAELVPKVVEWAEGPLAPIFGDSLRDPRVSLEIRDVHDVIVQHQAFFDAVLLDVDNGPDGLVNLANERLYSNWGLRAIHGALGPGGILAVWSAYPDHAFSDRLRVAGFDIEVLDMPSGSDEADPLHTIWLAAKSGMLGNSPIATATLTGSLATQPDGLIREE